MLLLDLPTELLACVADSSADALSLCRLASSCTAFRNIERDRRDAVWQSRAVKDFPKHTRWFTSGVLGSLGVEWKARYVACAREVSRRVLDPYRQRKPARAPSCTIQQLNHEYEFFLELHPIGMTRGSEDNPLDNDVKTMSAQLELQPAWEGHGVVLKADFPDHLELSDSEWIDSAHGMLNDPCVDVYARSKKDSHLALLSTIVVNTDMWGDDGDDDEHKRYGFCDVSFPTDQRPADEAFFYDDHHGPWTQLIAEMQIVHERRDPTKWRAFTVGHFSWENEGGSHPLSVDDFARIIFRRRASALYEIPCSA